MATKIVVTPYYNGFGDVIESTEGDIYGYLIANQTSTTETRTILKLDSTGLPVWLQDYTVGPNIFLGSNEYIPALVELGDAIVIKYNDEESDLSPYLMSLRKNNGSINWIRKYQMAGPFIGSQVYSLTSLVSDGNNIFMSGRSRIEINC